MKQYPKITLVFFGLGFLAGLLCVAVDLVYGYGSEAAQAQASYLFNHYLIILCPASIAFMAVDSPSPGIMVMASAFIFVVIMNAFIYAYVGAGILKLIRRFKRDAPKTLI